MSFKSHLVRLSHVHGQAYQRLYQAIDTLSEEDYRADRNLFFGSIHGTLNHLHLVDLLWFYRFKQEDCPFDVSGLDMELYADRGILKDELLAGAQGFAEFVSEQTADFFEQSLRVKTLSGGEVEHQAGWLVATVVNHGTHHRGQITAALNQIGVAYPPLDLPFYND